MIEILAASAMWMYSEHVDAMNDRKSYLAKIEANGSQLFLVCNTFKVLVAGIKFRKNLSHDGRNYVTYRFGSGPALRRVWMYDNAFVTTSNVDEMPLFVAGFQEANRFAIEVRDYDVNDWQVVFDLPDDRQAIKRVADACR